MWDLYEEQRTQGSSKDDLAPLGLLAHYSTVVSEAILLNKMGIEIEDEHRFVLGIVALLNPFTMPLSMIMFSYLFLAVGIFVVLWLMIKETVTYKHGILLLALYFIFLFVEIIM